jgi:hypothetical protein
MLRVVVKRDFSEELDLALGQDAQGDEAVLAVYMDNINPVCLISRTNGASFFFLE